MITERCLVLSAILVAMVSGCAQLPGRGPSGPEPLALPVTPMDGPLLRAKPSYENAQQLADSVKVGMPQRVVEAMFGPPDKAGYKVYGRAAGSPWRALVWEWVFQDATPPSALSIVFQEDESGSWRVNHGDWPE